LALQNVSRWQYMAGFGKVSGRLAPHDAIDNEFFRMADLAKFALHSKVVNDGVVSSWSADSRRVIAYESGSLFGIPNVA
jgi:hypothetical protein